MIKLLGIVGRLDILLTLERGTMPDTKAMFKTIGRRAQASI